MAWLGRLTFMSASKRMLYCESCWKRNLAFPFVKQRFNQEPNPKPMRLVLQRNNRSAVYRAFFGLANLDSADAILHGDGARRPAGTNALDHVAQFAGVAILAAQTKRSR